MPTMPGLCGCGAAQESIEEGPFSSASPWPSKEGSLLRLAALVGRPFTEVQTVLGEKGGLNPGVFRFEASSSASAETLRRVSEVHHFWDEGLAVHVVGRLARDGWIIRCCASLAAAQTDWLSLSALGAVGLTEGARGL